MHAWIFYLVVVGNANDKQVDVKGGRWRTSAKILLIDGTRGWFEAAHRRVLAP